ncbi:MAG: helix-turn-helix transcriptional regulator [Ruminococcaceae bacterium]|nr:helix-turn-helix transcriptional regulator [Oscillospiraceae bacterium]
MNAETTTLGQRIYQYRKEKNLSQEQLADLLDVSRQSISKWETDASVPELEKLLRMSDIFAVSLDELIRGNEKPGAHEQGKTTPCVPREAVPSQAASFSVQKIIGIILLCTGGLIFAILTALGGLFGGLLFSSPFLVCGILCLALKKRIGLWCGWALYFLIDLYLTYATGASRAAILMSLRWTSNMNYGILILSWIWFLTLLAMFAATLVSFRRTSLNTDRKTLTALVLSAALPVASAILSTAAGHALNEFLMNMPANSNSRVEIYLYQTTNFVLSWMSIIGVAVFLTLLFAVIRFRKSHRKEKNEKS